MSLFATDKPKPRNTNKAKGSAYENKIAKQLGEWIFNDKHMLCRHQTSGAKKVVYVGDIVPQKQLPIGWNECVWPFLIEIKNGYKNQIPNLNNQTIIRTWLNKALTEITPTQNIIYLITGFHGYSPLLITDVPCNLISDLIINIEYNKKYIPFHIYKFNDLITYEFDSLYINNTLMKERLFLSRKSICKR